MRLLAATTALTLCAACGPEAPTHESTPRTRLPGQSGTSIDPNQTEPGPPRLGPSVGSSSSNQPDAPPTPAVVPGEPGPLGEIFALGSGAYLYRIDPFAQKAELVAGFLLTEHRGECETQFSFNDIAMNHEGRLFAGGTMPFVYNMGAIYEVDPPTADVVPFMNLPFIPEGMTVTSEGWLAVVADGLWKIDLAAKRVERTLIGPGRFRATGGLVELDGKLLFTIAPDGHATYDLRTGELATFESAFDLSYQGLVVSQGQAGALLTDGSFVPINSSGPMGAPTMLGHSWTGATAMPE